MSPQQRLKTRAAGHSITTQIQQRTATAQRRSLNVIGRERRNDEQNSTTKIYVHVTDIIRRGDANQKRPGLSQLQAEMKNSSISSKDPKERRGFVT